MEPLGQAPQIPPVVQSKYDPKRAQRVIQDRLTCYAIITHQSSGQKARQFESRYQQTLKSVEIQPYERNLTATEDWQPLDCGWIEHCGMLLIRNNEGRLARTIPTEEEKARVARKVLEVGIVFLNDTEERVHTTMLVPPGETVRFYPFDAGELRIRCRSGEAKYTLFALAE